MRLANFYTGTPLPRLLIATNNAGKLAEYRRPPRRLRLGAASARRHRPPTLRRRDRQTTTRPTPASRPKPSPAHPASSTLADDSGLEVDALGGRPGPLSARYAGPNQTDEEGCRLVLAQMKDVPPERRQARFRCVIALAEPDGDVRLVEGECPGVITTQPHGSFGFGYDPIFYLPAPRPHHGGADRRRRRTPSAIAPTPQGRPARCSRR